MEIKNTLQPTVNPYTAAQNAQEATAARRAAAQNTQTAQSVPQGDRVSVSPEALLLTEAHKAAGAAPDIRQEKVDALKASVADGSYSIDSKQIAGRLLREEALLAGTLAE